MGQILLQDSIGTLSHSTGVISLTASTVTVGGQQYNTSTLTRTISTDVTMTANTLYMIYMVIVSGVPQLRISSNVNSVGPSGFTYWKLVGAFYADGLSIVDFGSFVNIENTPITNYMNYLAVFTGFGTATGINFRWRRIGSNLEVLGRFTSGTNTAVEARISLPSGYTTTPYAPTLSVLPASSFVAATSATGWTNNAQILLEGYVNYVTFALGSSTTLSKSTGNAFGNLSAITVAFSVPIYNWSNAPIKDL